MALGPNSPAAWPPGLSGLSGLWAGGNAAARTGPAGCRPGASPRAVVRDSHGVLRGVHGPARCERGDAGVPGDPTAVRRRAGGGAVGVAGLPAGPDRAAGAGGALVGPARPQAGVPVRLHSVLGGVRCVRPGPDAARADRAACTAGGGGGDAAGQQRGAGQHERPGQIPPGGPCRAGGSAGAGAGGRAGGRRRADRLGRVAVDLPGQRAGRAGRRGRGRVPAAALRSSCPRGCRRPARDDAAGRRFGWLAHRGLVGVRPELAGVGGRRLAGRGRCRRRGTVLAGAAGRGSADRPADARGDGDRARAGRCAVRLPGPVRATRAAAADAGGPGAGAAGHRPAAGRAARRVRACRGIGGAAGARGLVQPAALRGGQYARHLLAGGTSHPAAARGPACAARHAGRRARRLHSSEQRPDHERHAGQGRRRGRRDGQHGPRPGHRARRRAGDPRPARRPRPRPEPGPLGPLAVAALLAAALAAAWAGTRTGSEPRPGAATLGARSS